MANKPKPVKLDDATKNFVNWNKMYGEKQRESVQKAIDIRRKEIKQAWVKKRAGKNPEMPTERDKRLLKIGGGSSRSNRQKGRPKKETVKSIQHAYAPDKKWRTVIKEPKMKLEPLKQNDDPFNGAFTKKLKGKNGMLEQSELEKQILELIDEGFSDTEIAHIIEASGINKDEKGMIGDVKTNGGSLPKDTRKKVKDALNKAKTLGLKSEETDIEEGIIRKIERFLTPTKTRYDGIMKKANKQLESYINDLINEGFSDDEIVNLVEVRAGKIKLTPGKKLTPKEYKQMKAAALAKKKAKDTAKAAPPKEEPAVQSSGLDLITQHPDAKLIRSALSNVPAAHKQAAVSWLMNAIQDHKDNHIGAFVRNPHETMQSILKNNNKNKNKVSLPKLKFMGDE